MSKEELDSMRAGAFIVVMDEDAHNSEVFKMVTQSAIGMSPPSPSPPGCPPLPALPFPPSPRPLGALSRLLRVQVIYPTPSW